MTNEAPPDRELAGAMLAVAAAKLQLVNAELERAEQEVADVADRFFAKQDEWHKAAALVRECSLAFDGVRLDGEELIEW